MNNNSEAYEKFVTLYEYHKDIMGDEVFLKGFITGSLDTFDKNKLRNVYEFVCTQIYEEKEND